MVTNFDSKVAQIFGDLSGCFKHTNFRVKTPVAIFGYLLVEIGLLLVLNLVTLSAIR